MKKLQAWEEWLYKIKCELRNFKKQMLSLNYIVRVPASKTEWKCTPQPEQFCLPLIPWFIIILSEYYQEGAFVSSVSIFPAYTSLSPWTALRGDLAEDWVCHWHSDGTVPATGSNQWLSIFSLCSSSFSLLF